MTTIIKLILSAAAACLMLPGVASGFSGQTAQGAPYIVRYSTFFFDAAAIAPGDLNGDGTTDLAALATGRRIPEGTVRPYFGTAGAGLTAGGYSDVLAGSADARFALGDFDGDGIPDLAVTDPGPGKVSVDYGLGNATFSLTNSQLQSYPPEDVGPEPRGIAAADLDEDGNQDLVVATQRGVAVELGEGTGDFVAVGNDARFGEAASDLIATDLNGDAHVDVVATDSGSATLSVLLGAGNGRLIATPDSPYPGGGGQLLVADLNADGAEDVAALDAAGSALSVRLGDGNGALGAPIVADPGVRDELSSVAAGDLDGDGSPELAVAVPADDTVRILAGDGQGRFVAAAHGVVSAGGSDPGQLVIADLDHDQRLDLGVLNYGSDDLSVIYNRGVAAIEPAQTAVDFGEVRTGAATTTRTIPVRNAGDYVGSVRRVLVTGPDAGDFLISSDGCTDTTLVTEQSCSVGIRYAPSTDGTRAAVLEIRINGAPTQTVALSGSGEPAPSPVSTPEPVVTTPVHDPSPSPVSDPTPTPDPTPSPVTGPSSEPVQAQLQAALRVLRVRDNNVRVRFRASEAVSRFECQLDHGPFRECGSPQRYVDLAPGRHSISVRAIGESGEVSAVETRHFMIRGVR